MLHGLKLTITNFRGGSKMVQGWIETVDYMRTHKAETIKIESTITTLAKP